MCGVPVFANQRKSTRCRICIDARELNNFTNKEGDEEAADMDLQSRILEWRASKRVDCEDLKKAFWSVHIDESDVKWLGMCVGSRIIRWIHVPFGTNWSPWALSSVLGKILKQIGGTDGAEAISFYVDDVLLRGDSCSEVSKIRREVVPALEERGFEVHQDKRMSNLDTGEDCIGRGVSKEKILSEKFRTGDRIGEGIQGHGVCPEISIWQDLPGKFFDPMGLFAEVSLELRWAARLAHESLKQRRKDFEDGTDIVDEETASIILSTITACNSFLHSDRILPPRYLDVSTLFVFVDASEACIAIDIRAGSGARLFAKFSVTPGGTIPRRELEAMRLGIEQLYSIVTALRSKVT
ncbi:conserved hypothetical protein, partial [Perkinsus marinus ATCC 50983]